MKLKPIHWLLIAIGGIVLLFFVLLMTVLIVKFLTNPRTKSETPQERTYITTLT